MSNGTSGIDLRLEDVRCPVCSRLLGKRQPDGGVEILSGRANVLVHEGVLMCSRCRLGAVTVRREVSPAVLRTLGDVRT